MNRADQEEAGMKARIRKCGAHWLCQIGSVSGFGLSPLRAYDAMVLEMNRQNLLSMNAYSLRPQL